jgi:hypothetical protein
MSDTPEHYTPFAKSYGILIGILILWAGSLGLFFAGKRLFFMVMGGGDDSGG